MKITRNPISGELTTFKVNQKFEQIEKLLTLLPIYFGNGNPENVVSARVGSIFMRLDGSVGTTFYVKETGTDVTGWAAK